ncbi:2-nitropropane dioxygenase [Cytidiella melzeri]|nr:2-nitropropane dioxygenase [Cytidiella melzeri]
MQQPIRTAFTDLVGTKTPIVGAPMGYAWSAELAYAVASAGGFGMMGASLDTPEQLRTTLRTIRKNLGVARDDPLPIGVGFLAWLLDKTEVTESPRIPAVLDEKPKAVCFAFGNDLGKYIRCVREYEDKREHKTLVFVCINTVEEAVRAANEWKVDVIIAQGFEAGGHGSSYAPTTSILLAAVLAALPNGPPVLAAGGIATGAQMASLLALGASGVVLGTRLLFTNECQYTPTQKSILLNANLNSTMRGVCYDEVNRIVGWPDRIDGRAIANDVWADYKAGLPLEERLRKFDEGKEKGEANRVVVWAGAATALTKEIKDAADVVIEVHEEAVRRIKQVSSLLVASES